MGCTGRKRTSAADPGSATPVMSALLTAALRYASASRDSREVARLGGQRRVDEPGWGRGGLEGKLGRERAGVGTTAELNIY